MTEMNFEEFREFTGLEDGAVAFEPWDTFRKGILGITEDRKHIVYSYDGMAYALAEDYGKECEDASKCMRMATEWLDYNTIRSLPYIEEEHRPIIVMDVHS